MTTDALTVQGRGIQGIVLPPPMSIAEYKQQRELFQAVCKGMTDGLHYGLIPGTKKKSLWEAGAEELARAFAQQYHAELIERREDWDKKDFFYRWKYSRILGATADGELVLGTSWEGSAWSGELTFMGSGEGSGVDPGMAHHFVNDRAQKRAFVAIVRNQTGASAEFQEATVAADAEAARAATTGPMGWLEHCPAHGTKWRPSSNPEYSPSHIIKGKSPKTDGREAYCNMWPMLNRKVAEGSAAAAKRLGWDNKQAGDWMTKKAGKPKWGDVSPEDRVKAMMALETEADEQEANKEPPPTSTTGTTAVTPTPARTFKSPAEFTTACNQTYGLDARGIVEIIKEPLEGLAVADLGTAWAKVVAQMEPR